MALCIKIGDIVWLNGPYAPGEKNDLQIFRDCIVGHLNPNERVEADDGYVGEHPRRVKCPAGFANSEITLFMQQRVRNRQETINERFKNWGAMKQVWRHEIPLHGEAFRCIAVVLQLQINSGEKLFEIHMHLFLGCISA